jgi:hypothetical protein
MPDFLKVRLGSRAFGVSGSFVHYSIDKCADERRACERLDSLYKHGLGYAQEMSTRPQTMYAIADSPVGLAAWMLDHDARSYALIARVFDGQSEGSHARRCPRQHHALLVDDHGGLRGSYLLGKQVRLLCPETGRHPGRL